MPLHVLYLAHEPDTLWKYLASFVSSIWQSKQTMFESKYCMSFPNQETVNYSRQHSPSNNILADLF